MSSLEWVMSPIAIGQFTPGPVLSTATFVGFQVQGIWGALLATVGIFLPSFIFVAILNPLIPKLRQSKWASSFLDAVNVSALGLMAAVTLNLGRTVLTDWKAVLIVSLSILVVFRFKKVSSDGLFSEGRLWDGCYEITLEESHADNRKMWGILRNCNSFVSKENSVPLSNINPAISISQHIISATKTIIS